MHHEAALRAITGRHGVFFRGEAIEAGLDDRVLRREVRAGRLVRVRHGAYTFGDSWADLDDEGRHLVLVRAAVRSIGPAVAASHHSAAVVHGMRTWDVDLHNAHVTRLDGGAGRTESKVVHHEGLVLADDIVTVGETQVTKPARAALESASLSGVERGLVTVESGLQQKLFSSDELAEQHKLMESWPGSQHLHLVVGLADGRSQSVAESRTMHLCWSQGLPMPQQQYEVWENGVLVGVADFAWPKYGLLGEFDGRVKYGRYLRPGETPGDAVFREKQREDAMRRITGWRVIRLIWADLSTPVLTASRIRAMMEFAA